VGSIASQATLPLESQDRILNFFDFIVLRTKRTQQIHYFEEDLDNAIRFELANTDQFGSKK
jgi:hypothetical protein